MRTAAWLGPLVLVAGLALGALVAGGMYAREVAVRAAATPAAVGPVAPPAPVPLQAGPGDPGHGQVAYTKACAGCHGAAGKSSLPLHGPLLNTYYPDDATMAGLIRDGIGTMPGTSTRQLPDQDAADVIAYIRSLP
jgi:mono/diheme cytochrome c family protein